MILALALLCLVGRVVSRPNLQSLDLKNDGSYKFSYDTSKETGSHSRTEEKRPDGVVVGRYAYEDPTGDFRVVHYQAGDFGYVAKGAVGVAGAPDSQFPAEPVEDQEETNDANDDDKQRIDEDGPSDEVKEMKLPHVAQDDPPEGFPIGFFDRGFLHGFRRLPEPAREESNEAGAEENKADDSDDQKKTVMNSAVDYFQPIVPYSNFHPHTWTYPLQHGNPSHQPVYVYSYQIPQSHGYYYYY